MAALTSARSTWKRTLPSASLPLPTGFKATEGGMACIDTANPGGVYPGATGTATLIPIGKFTVSYDNTSGSASVNVSVDLTIEVVCRNWDSVTGSGAVTISNLLQEVYVASDHEVTTTVGSNGKAGRVWDVNGDGVWVQMPFSGQAAA
jgi:hypothetical protein